MTKGDFWLLFAFRQNFEAVLKLDADQTKLAADPDKFDAIGA
jgi:hypothetical protein